MNFVTFSTPFWMPPPQIAKPSTTLTVIQIIMSLGSPSMPPNTLLTSSAVMPAVKPPVRNFQK